MPLPDDRARAALLEPWLQRLPTPLFGGAQRPREPPLCRPRVPFLGDALRFGRDAGAFLAAERARHGDVFTVLIAGQRMTFVLDPHDAPQVLKQTEALRFHDLADKILVHAFGMDPAVVARSDAAVLHSLFGQHTKGPVLPALSARFGALVQRHLRAGPPHEGGLYERIYEPLFLAALDLLFGEGAADRRAYQDFRLFDDAFPLLAAAVLGGISAIPAEAACRTAGHCSTGFVTSTRTSTQASAHTHRKTVKVASAHTHRRTTKLASTHSRKRVHVAYGRVHSKSRTQSVALAIPVATNA